MGQGDTARTAICPGSYDPITNGHLDMIRRAAKVFDRVVVAVAGEAQKEHLFSLEERLAMAREACAGLEGIEVRAFDGLLVEAAREVGAVAIVKGLRDPADAVFEARMAYMNRTLMPALDTIFMLADPNYIHITSSLVKWICRLGGDVAPYVPPGVIEKLVARLRPR